MKMDTLDYLKNLKEYLSSDNAEYKFAKSEFILQYILSGNMKVKYLQCKLLKVRKMKYINLFQRSVIVHISFDFRYKIYLNVLVIYYKACMRKRTVQPKK